LARPEIFEARKLDRPNGIIVADYGGRSFERIYDMQQLPSIQELPMGKMHVRESYITELDDLRNPRRNAAWDF
jgi:hypothetical protein